MNQMRHCKKIRLIPSDEIKTVIQDCKRKMWSHIEERQEHQVNQKFISYMEETIEELNEVLKARKVA
jgi:hypothetical protein